jgi:hypothetical protein
VLVYRQGHTPQDLPEDAFDFRNGMTVSKLNPQTHKNRVKPAKTQLLEELPEELQNSLIKLNPVKRDRRTAADVVEDIKRRKES